MRIFEIVMVAGETASKLAEQAREAGDSLVWGRGGACTPSLPESGNENLCLQEVSPWDTRVLCVAKGILCLLCQVVPLLHTPGNLV